MEWRKRLCRLHDIRVTIHENETSTGGGARYVRYARMYRIPMRIIINLTHGQITLAAHPAVHTSFSEAPQSSHI